jgi:TRAP-type C4-dicarboxylate transport system permease small subunit
LARIFNKALDNCNLALASVAAVLMLFMMLSVCFTMLTRYLFNRPFAFIIDFTTYSLVYVTFLGAPWLLQLRKHVAVDLVPEAMPPHIRRWWNVALDLTIMFIAVVICYVSAQLTMGFYAGGVTAADLLRTPRWLLVVSIPVGCFFLAVQALRNAIEDINAPVKGGGLK